jgi:hypothetical protein
MLVCPVLKTAFIHSYLGNCPSQAGNRNADLLERLLGKILDAKKFSRDKLNIHSPGDPFQRKEDRPFCTLLINLTANHMIVSLHAPGRAIAYICAVARVTSNSDSCILMGGDGEHQAG